ncbi:MAG TPA: PVC-type heme-binding CxxCH protein [Longimicrobiaceae bacterium]
MKASLIIGTTFGLAVVSAFAAEQLRPRAAELEGIEVASGLEATLFAESPMLTNPTNLDVDHRGRVWVVEGYNYRNSLHPDQPVREEGDRVVILEDSDGDGAADVQKVFYQGRDIDAAMGIAVLGNQVIVSSYGQVLRLTDTDGDDRADQKEVIFRLNDADHDHTVHAFVFGPDGRLYFNVGDEGKFVLTPAGDTIVDLAGNKVTSNGNPYRKGMAFRVEPDGSRFEVLGHNFRNPYEVSVDAYGTLWQSDNDDDGNRAVRINFVMEGGNYGYTDEMTGAGWRTPRTGMADSIPLRHWHLNDPGVVPNVLQTGAGSPAGIMVYEGSLLPERYHNAMIHADAGVRVVRAYPVEKDGAGYRGRIEPILTGTDDPLFRPVDVAAAPDGSLFVADWYDPGVGGHNVRDLTYGRVIRVAPPQQAYRVMPADLSTAEGAARALSSPNQATRYLAYRRLESLGAEEEAALRAVWESGSSREKARALWLLGLHPERGERYIDEALSSDDPDLRITGLRVARRAGLEILPLARRLVHDPSPQVRREVALALRYEDDPQTAEVWAELALQHDGRDRWYLEALGIAADGRWDQFFAAWVERAGDRLNTPAARDVVWRARTDAALPRLAAYIRATASEDEERLRYFRAFDFHQGAAREQTLLTLLDGDHPDRDAIAALALMHLTPEMAAGDGRVASALRRALDAVRGTERFVQLAERYEARERANELVDLALAQPDSSAGIQAARLALNWGAADGFASALAGDDEARTERATLVLGAAGSTEAVELLQNTVTATDRPLSLRRAAVQALGRTQSGERQLLELVRQRSLPADLEPAAAAVLFSSFRSGIREAAAEYLTPPAAASADGAPLPPVGELARQRGDVEAGRAVFARACAVCHTAEGVGNDFGPGLSTIGAKLSRGALYTAILEPSAGISFNYLGESIRLDDGTEVSGIVAGETENELTLRLPGGVSARYAKTRVEARQRLDGSLMPDNLEQAMTRQELVDLVEYLASLR